MTVAELIEELKKYPLHSIVTTRPIVTESRTDHPDIKTITTISYGIEKCVFVPTAGGMVIILDEAQE